MYFLLIASIYLMLVVNCCNSNRFFGIQYTYIFENKSWKTYKRLKENTELYDIIKECDAGLLLSGTKPYFIFIWDKGMTGCFLRQPALGENSCKITDGFGGQFLLEDLINIKR